MPISCGKPKTKDELRILEAKFKVGLPEDYKEFLRLKLDEVLHAGKNPYDIVSHLPYEQRLKMNQEQIKSRGGRCG
ncbi:SMI1/KNR4 family protein [Enterobacter bugandensis]|uniref:SMI1/KNR4 family protein n=1 Tax=Enterobacter bugandensis TaxID=881260 RepID=UPI00064287EB|nr:SMI1/KNR4 family protein [Enterobacter bugandensis]EMC1017034.1 SMI1/KNR4 family protein [Enterobacter bugandensis]KLR26634.1 hypothetical protein ABR26_02610 [Enterobacter bugandensis]MDX7626949.1 SMI1/KNR4 family protein [Enterobacter bugandensis]